jgi:hypothetical protein
MNIATAVATISAVLAEADKDVPAILSFISSTVVAVENKALSGPDKLTAVLNASEVFVNSVIPTLSAPMHLLMAAIATFVNALVALYNEAGVFIHAIKAAVQS